MISNTPGDGRKPGRGRLQLGWWGVPPTTRAFSALVGVVLLLLPPAAASVVTLLSPSPSTASVDLVVKVDSSSANASAEVSSTLDLLTTRSLLEPIARRRHEAVSIVQQRVHVQQVGGGGLATVTVTGPSRAIALDDAATMMRALKSTITSLDTSSSQERSLNAQLDQLNKQQQDTQDRLLELAPKTSARERESYRQLVVRSEQLAQRLTDVQEKLSDVSARKLDSVGAIQQLSAPYLNDSNATQRLLQALALGAVIGFLIVSAYLWLLLRSGVSIWRPVRESK